MALGVVYVVWGSTYLAIRVGVRRLPPLVFAGSRYVIAGILLYPISLWLANRPPRSGAIRPGGGNPSGAAHGVASEGAAGRAVGARAKDGARPGTKAWLSGAVVGTLLLAGGNGGVTFAERTLPSGLAAVLVATVPLWMIVFAWPLSHEPVTRRSAAGIVIGLVGVGVLAGGGAASGRISGVIIVLVAAACWGFGSVLSHRLPLPSHAMLAAAIEMLVGGIVLLAVGAGAGEFSQVHLSSVPATSFIALAYLIGPGSILAFSAYGYALSHLPVSTVSTYAFVNPVVAVLAGAVILGEHLSWREGLGATLVVASIVIIQVHSRKAPQPDR
jgi:drug/metabolite transporter (DMT)-like permease